MSCALKVLYGTPLVAFNFVLPSAIHIIPPAIVPRRFQRLLSLGTHFIPNDYQFVEQSIESSLQAFETRLRWSQVFGFGSKDDTYPIFKVSKGAAPPDPTAELSKYLQDTRSKLLRSVSQTHTSRNSFFVKEINQFKKYMQNRYILKPADKNLGLTIMTQDFYQQMCMEHLAATCVQLENVSESLVVNMLQDLSAGIIHHHSDTLSDEVFKFLMEKESKCTELANFYALPKLHKASIGPRPIVAAHSCPLSVLSSWLCKALQPVVERQAAYLRDTQALVQILARQPFPQTSVMLTFDVASMYPNMQKNTAWIGICAGLQLSQLYLEEPPSWFHFARNILDALFDHCYSKFDNKIFKQTNGIAMGTDAAPVIANLYLTPWEHDFTSNPDIYLYKRFIDDGFAIVDSFETANSILAHLRQSGFDFTFEMSQSSATFMDLSIYRGSFTASTGILCFRTYRKALNRFLYLPAFSAHHPSTVKSWIYAEILRLRNTSLLDDDFLDACMVFLANLAKRGYSSKLVQSALDMLPDHLLSPLTRTTPNKTLSAPIDSRGQAYAKAPPTVFRAPFALHQRIPYGKVLHEGLEEWLKSTPGARSANPNPNKRSPKTSPTALNLVVANTLSKSLLKRLSKAKFQKTDGTEKHAKK